MTYQLLDTFAGLFEGRQYLHRDSTSGDSVALRLYEDLYEVRRSQRFVERVDRAVAVANLQNQRQGIRARRGDGSLGEILPHVDAVAAPGFHVRRGPIATIEIGVEVKVLMKAMLKQIDRVIRVLRTQADDFRMKGEGAICIGIVGVNCAPHCTTYEGDRSFRTDGRKHKHPIAEADEAERRLRSLAAPAFDEFLVMRFEAANEPPFSFQWDKKERLERDYGALLVRVSQGYDNRR